MPYRVIKKETETVLAEYSFYEDAEEFFRKFRISNKRTPVQLIKMVDDNSDAFQVLVTYLPD